MHQSRPTPPCTQLRWELGSPLFGLLLRHYAPDDTYTVHKVRAACPAARKEHRQTDGAGPGGGRGGGPAPCTLGLREHPCSWPTPTPPAPALPLALSPLRHVDQVGNLLRVDGTLMGPDDRSRSFIPRWKRGHFSLLVDAGAWHRGGGGTSPTQAFASVDIWCRLRHGTVQRRGRLPTSC